MSALPELELSELELEMETTSPLDEAPDELLDESAAGALAAMQNSCSFWLACSVAAPTKPTNLGMGVPFIIFAVHFCAPL